MQPEYAIMVTLDTLAYFQQMLVRMACRPFDCKLQLHGGLL